MNALWEAVKRQWVIQDTVSMDRLKPDQTRIIDPKRGTCRIATHFKVRQYAPLDARLYPFDVHVLKLKFLPTMPSDIVVFHENPKLYVDPLLTEEDVSDSAIWRTWDIRYYDVNLEYTSPQMSFTSNSYHQLDISFTIARKKGYVLETVLPFSKVLVFLMWCTALITDIGLGLLVTALLYVTLIYLFRSSDRPGVPYMTLFDKRFHHTIRWGTYPALILQFIFAIAEKGLELRQELQEDFAIYVLYARLGSFVLTFLLWKLGNCLWFCRLESAIMKNAYMLNIQSQTALSSKSKQADLPPDMSIFTLWESKQFIGRQNSPLPESSVNRLRPRSAPPKRTNPKYTVYSADTPGANSHGRRETSSSGDEETRRVRFSLPEDDSGDGVSGREEWPNSTPGKMYFKGRGTLQDNTLRQKVKGVIKRA